jgi:hypothetical protein
MEKEGDYQGWQKQRDPRGHSRGITAVSLYRSSLPGSSDPVLKIRERRDAFPEGIAVSQSVSQSIAGEKGARRTERTPGLSTANRVLSVSYREVTVRVQANMPGRRIDRMGERFGSRG